MASKIEQQIASAKQAGYKDHEIWNELRKNPDFINGVKQARSSGYKQEDIAKNFGLRVKFVNTQPTPKPEKPSFIADVGAGIDDIYSGIAQGAEYVADGIRGATNKALGTNLDTNRYEKYTKYKADEKKTYEQARKESGAGMNVGRFIGQTVATAPVAGLSKGYGAAKILSKPGLAITAQNALVGGAVGGVGFAENAAQRKANIASGAVGGALGGIAGDKIGKGIAKATQKIVPSAKATAQARVSATVDDQIEIALKQSNIKMSDLSDDVLAGLRKDVAAALKSGKAVNKEAIARKVVLDRVGIRPTQAQLTGDPKLWQKQAELAKINGAGDPLRDKLVQDNVQLAGLLDDAIKNTHGKAADQYAASQSASDALSLFDRQAKDRVKELYQGAMKAPGNDVVLDGRGFANDAITKLDEQYAMSSLSPSVSKIIKDIEKNPQAFTLGKSEELIKILNREYKASLQNGQPSSSTYAIGLVRDVLNNRQDEALQGMVVSGNNNAAQWYQAARTAYKNHAQVVEKIPLLKDTLKGVEPDKLFQKHILNGNAAELTETMKVLAKVDPTSIYNIKQQTLQYISDKAVNQNGQFSPAGMKRALDAIGDRRLNILFAPKEVAHIKDIGMAGQYLVTQPAHSYVNNSNTSVALMNFLGGVINKPGVRVLLSPLKDVADSVQVNRAMKANLAGDAKASADVINNVMFSEGDKRMIEQLTKLGVIGGANTTQ